MTFFFRDRGIVVITSENFDGEWIARIIARFGYGTARGSSSRNAQAAALLQLVRGCPAGRPTGVHAGRPARAGARGASPARCGSPAPPGTPLLPFHIEAERELGRSGAGIARRSPSRSAACTSVVGAPIDAIARGMSDRRPGAGLPRPRGRARAAATPRVRTRRHGRRDGTCSSSTSARFGEHTPPPGHPERPERADVMDAVAARVAARGGARGGAAAGDRGTRIRRVHSAGIRRGAGIGGRARGDARSRHVHVAGVLGRRAAGRRRGGGRRRRRAGRDAPAALSRWCGRPATTRSRDRAMGFCLFNNVAVAAAHALDARPRARRHRRLRRASRQRHAGDLRGGSPRALRLDAPVSVLPGTGPADDVGRGAGRGFTVNVPIEARRHRRRLRARVRARSSRRSSTPVRAGAGARLGRLRRARARSARRHAADARPASPRMTGQLCAVADGCAAGRVVLVTEGGYDLRALASLAWRPSLSAMDGRRGARSGSRRGRRCVRARRRGGRSGPARSSRPFWRGL